MPNYYGTFLHSGIHWICKDCGARITSTAELRWCPVCQANIWTDDMKEYRELMERLHEMNKELEEE